MKIAAILLAFIACSRVDFQEQKFSEKHYCQMVKIWKVDHRHGWPPYRDDVPCE